MGASWEGLALGGLSALGVDTLGQPTQFCLWRVSRAGPPCSALMKPTLI